jgi:hypothetical protein
MAVKKKSQTRLYLSIALCLGALLASFLMTRAANTQEDYWVVLRPMAAGTQIGADDLGYQSVVLGAAAKNYLAATTNPIGSITRRRLVAGELLQGSSLTDDARALTHQEISLSMRAVDIPFQVAVGELISLYQLHDVRESKEKIAPEFIVSGAFVTSIDRKGSNFGGEVALGLAIDRVDVANVLSASTSGRLVVVRARG